MTQDTKREALIAGLSLVRRHHELTRDDIDEARRARKTARGCIRLLDDVIAAISTHPTPTAEQGGEVEKAALKLVLEMADSLGADPPGRMGVAHNAYRRAQCIAAKHRATLTKSNGDPA